MANNYRQLSRGAMLLREHLRQATQEKVAAAAGLTRSAVSRHAAGDRQPSRTAMRGYRKSCGIPEAAWFEQVRERAPRSQRQRSAK